MEHKFLFHESLSIGDSLEARMHGFARHHVSIRIGSLLHIISQAQRTSEIEFQEFFNFVLYETLVSNSHILLILEAISPLCFMLHGLVCQASAVAHFQY